MPTLFTKIINGQIPSYKLYEDEFVIAILDIFPKQIGHTLIIPKVEIDYWVDLPDDLVLNINKVAQKVGEEAVELVIEAKDNNKELFLNEAADLMYHYLLLLTAKGFSLCDVEQVLEGRHK